MQTPYGLLRRLCFRWWAHTILLFSSVERVDYVWFNKLRVTFSKESVKRKTDWQNHIDYYILYLLIRYFTCSTYCMALAGGLDKLSSFNTKYNIRPPNRKIIKISVKSSTVNMALVKYWITVTKSMLPQLHNWTQANVIADSALCLLSRWAL